VAPLAEKETLISLVLPVLNQATHLGKMVEQHRLALETTRFRWELLLVVNGSQDQSYALACEESGRDCRVRAFEIKRAGLGRALKFGLQRAEGHWVGFTNSARTHHLELSAFLQQAVAHSGSMIRAVRRDRDLSTFTLRGAGSFLFRQEILFLFGMDIRDPNGKPKLFPREILERLRLDDFGDGDLFDAELLIESARAGIRDFVVPVPPSPRLDGHSTTTFLSALRLYAGLLGYRCRLRRDPFTPAQDRLLEEQRDDCS
jgi:glycosyltransferase involved in cell wall biosynthesis